MSKQPNLKNEGPNQSKSPDFKKPGYSNAQSGDHNEGSLKSQEFKPSQDSHNKPFGQYSKKEGSCGCGPSSCSSKSGDMKKQDQTDRKQGKSPFDKSREDVEQDEEETDISYSENDDSQEEDLTYESSDESLDEEGFGKQDKNKAKNEESIGRGPAKVKSGNEEKRKNH